MLVQFPLAVLLLMVALLLATQAISGTRNLIS